MPRRGGCRPRVLEGNALSLPCLCLSTSRSRPRPPGCIKAALESLSELSLYEQKPAGQTARVTGYGSVSFLPNHYQLVNSVKMSTTVMVDKVGRMVLPKPVRMEVLLRSIARLALMVLLCLVSARSLAAETFRFSVKRRAEVVANLVYRFIETYPFARASRRRLPAPRMPSSDGPPASR